MANTLKASTITGMITELTIEQESAIPVHAEKWKKISLSTDPINFELAKKSVTKLYELSGLKQPEKIIKILSPLKMTNVKFIGDDDNVIFNTITTEIGNYTNDRVSRVLSKDISNIINDVIGNSININVIKSIKSNKIDHNNIINNNIINNNIINNNIINGGSIWTYYYAYYSFFRDILKIKLPEIYNHDEQLSINSTFSILGKNKAYICDSPKSINIQTVNNITRLHNISGPAIHWRDNYKQWYIEGIEVDEQIVMNPETQTIDQINSDWNEERRRIKIERYGWIKYLENSGAKLINSRINERDNQQEQLYQHKESNRFICVDPSTGRKYAIAVPHIVKTCLEAQKYLSHGLDQFAIHRS